ncbi:MAG: hypothetical protein A2X64_04270 [Ignavibacteria bacterium GWF2_33_9]|nr:MAG: hypothetical protein A2X64_04270 [Ignavibacteria bacterium GWF2_33_9]
MIDVDSLSIKYNGITIIHNLTFSVGKGEIFSFYGDSGKGKTSIFSCLLGFQKPASGNISIDGELLSKSTIHSIRNKVAWLPQNINNFPNISIREQIHLFRKFKLNTELYSEEKFLKFTQLFRLKDDILTAHFSELSGGEKQRVVLIYTLLQNKKILLFDEPTSGLDEQSEASIIDYMRGQRDLTILTSTHSKTWLDFSTKTLKI